MRRVHGDRPGVFLVQRCQLLPLKRLVRPESEGLFLQASTAKGERPVARLPSGLVQYVLHALLQQCRAEIADQFLLSDGILEDGTGARSRGLDPTVSPLTVHPHRPSVARLGSTTGFDRHAYLVGREISLQAIAQGPIQLLLSRLPHQPQTR